MERSWIASFLLAGAALAGPALAHPRGLSETPAALVAVSLELDGRPASLYPAPDGSGRFYVEAREGACYSVVLANRSGERVGVVLSVDGLNAISGARDAGRGRMYVLDPGQRTTVRGWRTSLQEVRQFTFVDERASYAARSGKANEKMGWIEVAAYRERRPFVRHAPASPRPGPYGAEGDSAGKDEGPAERPARSSAEAAAPSALGGAQARSYPGTGWGRRTDDPAVLVSFDPETDPCERVTLRYEYRPALVALGVLPRRLPPPRDRLRERDHADAGFAPPPLW
ncbi:MAG TPA: hypothetical protein VLF95_05415 [Vicinamibacteria bacterium]|nr:hypothetical protein [Vicinamibacteria bacterium]